MSVRPAESLLPLADIRIIDFSWSRPGPYATHMLADLGATVEVVDLVGRPDIFRMLPPLAADASYAWDYVNQNKLRRSVDHRDSAAVAAFHGEIAGYDVLVEQFRPGAMEAWGLGYASLAAIHPGLIYCSITGFNQNGACSGRAGHDINYMALSGVAHGLRGADGVPALSALPFADMAGGSLHAAVGILAALQGRAKTGKGAHVDISMTGHVVAQCLCRTRCAQRRRRGARRGDARRRLLLWLLSHERWPLDCGRRPRTQVHQRTVRRARPERFS